MYIYLPFQALLEMADIATGQAMVNYYTDRPPQIRGRTVYVQFSNHIELKTETSAQVGGIVCIVLLVSLFTFFLPQFK